VRPRRIAVVTHGLEIGGGVPVVARWLQSSLRDAGQYDVDIHDLATSSCDTSSRRVAKPQTWARRSLQDRRKEAPRSTDHWGANAVELEFMRYQRRRELTRVLRRYDLIQVVAGSPAWSLPAGGCGRPVALQVATTASWERRSQLAVQSTISRGYRRLMTVATSRIERRALHSVDAVLVENSEMHSLLESLGHGYIVHAPPGIDTDLYTPSGRGWRREGYLLSVCRLGDPRKGLDRTVRAYAELVMANERAPNLIMAGKGRISDSLGRLISALEIGHRVKVISDLAPADLVETYRGASVFLQTSHEEGLGLSVLEAMACGLPVVATRTAGSSVTVIDGVTGWLIPQNPENEIPAAMAARISMLLAGDGGTIAFAARERCVSAFSSRVALKRFTDVYEDLWSGPSGVGSTPC
jgi:glycosyltransferase involved in cell wall biosynthesis